MKKKKNIFVFSTTYSLLLYLLYHDLETIKNTLYITQKSYQYAVPKTIKNKLIKHIEFNTFNGVGSPNKLKVIMFFINNLIYNFFQNIYIQFLTKNSNIYIHNNQRMSGKFAKNNYFTIIEDGIGNQLGKFSSKKEKPNTISNKSILNQLRDYIYGVPMINTKNIKKHIVTKSVDEKNEEIISIQNLWQNSSKEKQQYILNIFGIDQKVLQDYNFESILLTQPMNEYGVISTEKEKISFYKGIIEKENKSVLIKTHPAEKTDYKKYFPETTIFENPIPFEIFELLGIQFKRAYTISSTAALNFNYPIEIIPIQTGLNLYEDGFKEILNRRKNERFNLCYHTRI
ncbi:hypothetical protein MSHRCOH1_08705 [Candidatus Ornithobacterium hominis]|uniref:glycosyltransferase family 52 n=1 Tax=Candidatus Ornithobacterium hominis TaxID=2497989 RepID=UPI0024BC2999|nr:glycosyltransferase family 52 [Candidatus Ornithobacterium hominis]CAI9430268.1 hypothetical protein MSHRCOH1_08705 [Candidatus Ornithobacterium hominis]